MMPHALNIGDAAALLGRSPDWLRHNWRDLVTREGFPRPLLARGELVWAKLHLLAWVDRQLPDHMRAYVQAMRLAEMALAGEGERVGAFAEARRTLAERLGAAERPATSSREESVSS